MSYIERNPYIARIQQLEEDLEAMRQRAETLELALGGRLWAEAVAPLSLYQTRILRLLLKRDIFAETLLSVLLEDYPNTSQNALKSQISIMRTRLPASIVPPLKYSASRPYTIPDREALKAFLETGVLPEQRRIAA